MTKLSSLIAGIIFGYISDFIGFRAKFEYDLKNQIEDKRLQIKQNNFTGIFIENVGFIILVLLSSTNHLDLIIDNV